METSQLILDRLFEVGFRAYSKKEIQKLSVKEIINPQLFDNLGLPAVGGLYDPTLGPTRHDDICDTCGQTARHCPGHFGHISLALPVFNPIFFKTMFKILQGTCLTCYRVMVPEIEAELFMYQMQLLEKGCVLSSLKLEEFFIQIVAQTEKKISKFEILPKLKAFANDLLTDEASTSSTVTKMVDSEFSSLVSNMLKKYFVIKKSRPCPYCKTTPRYLRQEYSSRISVSGRTANESLNVPAKTKKKPSSSTPDYEEPVEAENEMPETTEVDTLLAKGEGKCMLMPHLAKQILREAWKRDGKLLQKIFHCLEKVQDTEAPTDMFFVESVLVPPARFRPLNVLGDRKFENPQTASLSRVLSENYEISQLLSSMKSSPMTTVELDVEKTAAQIAEQLQSKWFQLQTLVNSLIDSDLDKITADNKKIPGVRQMLEKKEGLFRMHMMGKRVNYAARSVISPDPCIGTDEIGVPLVFAQKLTFPKPVTPWNVHELRQNVINGPNVYPGATLVVKEDGNVIRLSATDRVQREAVAKQLLTPSHGANNLQLPKQVYCHLKNGDVLLLNRQPTLHRPSIQAHKARVLHGQKTMRLHYANCKAYNADFDGDEMNAHFPQSELCRAEAYGIVGTQCQYLVPKDGTPLAGLIQDHINAGVLLTIRGQFFNRQDYCNLLEMTLTRRQKRIHLLPPAILKPCCMWSGKQVFSTLLLNLIPEGKKPLSLFSKTKIPEKSWTTKDVQSFRDLLSLEQLGESTVIIKHGELLQGVLDKSQCGPSPFGLVHSVYELYGGNVAYQLLTCLGRLFTSFLSLQGFTLGIEDVLVKTKDDSRRRKVITESSSIGHQAALVTFGMTAEECSNEELMHKLREAHFASDDFKMQELDATTKKFTDRIQDKIVKCTMPKGLFKSFPANNLQLMVQSGAKGSTVNCMQMSCLLGQIELEGRRPSLMKSGRSVPSFHPYDMSPRARGFVMGRFLTGIKTQELFFHCMAGREGLVDTAVKTSRSGYLQRCLIKHLEGIMVNYDMTVRDSDGSIVQFYYGEDGMEVNKTPFLQSKQLPFLLQNKDVICARKDLTLELKEVRKTKKKINKWERKHKTKERASGFLNFCSDQNKKHLNSLGEDLLKIDKNVGRTVLARRLQLEWRGLDLRRREKYSRKCSCPDPVMSIFWPQAHTGVIPENLQKSLGSVQQDLLAYGRTGDAADLETIVYNKAVQSLCQPGEAVGLVCAQSIGEPSTQMTLNTFHFAGRGEMNVTLGIPRLREILMTASHTIKTPLMDVPVFNTPEALTAAQNLQRKLNRVTLSEVLQTIETTEYLFSDVQIKDERRRMYKIHFTILPWDSYKEKLQMKPRQIVKYIEDVFLPRLCRAALEAMKKKKKEIVSHATIRRIAIDQEQADAPPLEDVESDDEIDDGDATADKARDRQADTLEYQGEEDEKMEIGETDQVEDDMEDLQPENQTIIKDEDLSDSENHETEERMDRKGWEQVREYRRHKKGKWCEAVLEFQASGQRVDIKSLVTNKAQEAVIQQVKGITRCFLTNQPDNNQRVHLRTEGVNIQEIIKYLDILDLNELYTNSIADIQTTYGIEAATKAIIKEVKDVFAVYGIQVDYHHLSLVADYMTYQGSYTGFNRMSMGSNPSPLQKITFETSVNFLLHACTNARPDQLRSPSARIIAGQVVHSGTGAFDILQKLSV
ncbi:DNA-directed RNA polymerase I subunit RPA1-like [Pomacea canaliculata]|uniref:DNA-directed RNA polymerase I subunit RPA1-like n=1 Tax=Pomacea canaliculata TaxID=400727 RepID=UPI000D728582|nr:DNA-directed RNA polymerase I subunit RPA1-like [Pomacea canaliculata]